MPDSSAPGPEETPSPLEPGSAGENSAPEPRTRRTRNVVIGGAVVGVLALGGAGAYAYTALSGGGAQPHDVLPGNALAYARVDLDPSAGQKVEILRLLQKFPDLKDSIGDENADLRELFIKNTFGEDCDVDFAADVEPWLGQRVGMALLSEPLEPVIAVQVDDETKARAGVAQLTECSDDETSAIAFLDGYAIVGPEQATVDAAVAGAKRAPLGEKAEFAQALDSIGDQGIASGWMDYGAIMSHPDFEGLLAEGAQASGQPPVEIPEMMSELGAVTLVVRAESSAIELRGTAEGSGNIYGDSTLDVADVPDSTVFAAGSAASEEFDGWYESMMTESLATAGIDEQTAAEFETTMGVSLEEIFSLFASGPLLTVGERGLADMGGFTGPESVGSLDVALRTHGDQAELRDIHERLAEAAAMLGVELVVEDIEGGVALATAPSALEAGAGLTSTEAFRSVVPFDTVTSVSYVDFDKLQPVIEVFAEGDEAVVKNLEPLRALGASASGDEFSLRLSFND